MFEITYRDFFPLLEASTAGEEAKRRGLKHVGFGKYADRTGKVIAHSAGGKLVYYGASSPKVSTKPVSAVSHTSVVTPASTKVTPSAQLYIHKAKPIQKVNSLSTNAFNQGSGISTEEYKKLSKGTELKTEAFHFPVSIRSHWKIPKKYVTILERMVNTVAKKKNGDAVPYAQFTTQPSGAGTTISKAGELLVLASATLNDHDAEEFYTSILNHIAGATSQPLVDKSWVVAAKKQRFAIRKRWNKEFGNYKILAGAWDVESEVEALGLENYRENKGFSTDVYFKLMLPNGKEILDEVSLKKDRQINFLNSHLSLFSRWDKNSKTAKINFNLRQNQSKKLILFSTMFEKHLESLIGKDEKFTQILRSSKFNSVKEVINELTRHGTSKQSRKILWLGILALARRNVSAAKKYIELEKKQQNYLCREAIQEISRNDTLKTGMLNEIKNNFPLKSVADGEETMAIGDISFDAAVMKKIFGTTNYNEIKEHLVAVGTDKPILGYQASVKDKIIPIANVEIRPDRAGYVVDPRFTMKLLSSFGNLLKNANKEIYGE